VTDVLLRRLILSPKKVTREERGWANPPVPPRFTPFPRGLRLGPDWIWRAVSCQAGDKQFQLLGLLNNRKGNYKAWLLYRVGADWSLLARL
jgi:hypothetical protein